MLSPLAEQASRSRLGELGMESLQLFPGYTADLSRDSGLDIMPRSDGALRPVLHPEDEPLLREYLDWLREKGLPARWLSPDETVVRAPFVGAVPSLESPAEQYILPRQLLKALVRAACSVGVELFSHTAPTGFVTSRRRLESVHTTRGTMAAFEVVLAAGAWTAGLAARLGLRVPVRPVYGQLLQLRGRPRMSHALFTAAGFLSPRPGGRLLIGSTEEEVGFRHGPTSEGIQRLLAMAAAVAPETAMARLENAWAGLRPGTPDHLPIIGPAPGWENLSLATGHFRKGILLAPLTSQILVPWLLGRCEHPQMKYLTLERFEGRSRE